MTELISDQDQLALLREGIVVLTARMYEDQLYVNVTGADDDRVRAVVRARLGAGVDVGVCGAEPREIRPIACEGHMEREEGRLQLRYVMHRGRHLDEIEVTETDETVTIYGTVCVPLLEEPGDEIESPYHVYLDRPLGGRTVIDGVTGRTVPYTNVYEELKRKYGLPSA